MEAVVLNAHHTRPDVPQTQWIQGFYFRAERGSDGPPVTAHRYKPMSKKDSTPEQTVAEGDRIMEWLEVTALKTKLLLAAQGTASLLVRSPKLTKAHPPLVKISTQTSGTAIHIGRDSYVTSMHMYDNMEAERKRERTDSKPTSLSPFGYSSIAHVATQKSHRHILMTDPRFDSDALKVYEESTGLFDPYMLSDPGSPEKFYKFNGPFEMEPDSCSECEWNRLHVQSTKKLRPLWDFATPRSALHSSLRRSALRIVLEMQDFSYDALMEAGLSDRITRTLLMDAKGLVDIALLSKSSVNTHKRISEAVFGKIRQVFSSPNRVVLLPRCLPDGPVAKALGTSEAHRNMMVLGFMSSRPDADGNVADPTDCDNCVAMNGAPATYPAVCSKPRDPSALTVRNCLFPLLQIHNCSTNSGMSGGPVIDKSLPDRHFSGITTGCLLYSGPDSKTVRGQGVEYMLPVENPMFVGLLLMHYQDICAAKDTSLKKHYLAFFSGEHVRHTAHRLLTECIKKVRLPEDQKSWSELQNELEKLDSRDCHCVLCAIAREEARERERAEKKRAAEARAAEARAAEARAAEARAAEARAAEARAAEARAALERQKFHEAERAAKKTRREEQKRQEERDREEEWRRQEERGRQEKRRHQEEREAAAHRQERQRPKERDREEDRLRRQEEQTRQEQRVAAAHREERKRHDDAQRAARRAEDDQRRDEERREERKRRHAQRAEAARPEPTDRRDQERQAAEAAPAHYDAQTSQTRYDAQSSQARYDAQSSQARYDAQARNDAQAYYNAPVPHNAQVPYDAQVNATHRRDQERSAAEAAPSRYDAQTSQTRYDAQSSQARYDAQARNDAQAHYNAPVPRNAQVPYDAQVNVTHRRDQKRSAAEAAPARYDAQTSQTRYDAQAYYNAPVPHNAQVPYSTQASYDAQRAAEAQQPKSKRQGKERKGTEGREHQGASSSKRY